MSNEEIANRRQLLDARTTRKKRNISQHPGLLHQYRKKRVKRAIEGSRGHIGTIAQILGCRHYTVSLILQRARALPAWAGVIKLYEYEAARMIDMALGNIIESIDPQTNPDLESRVRDSKWVLERRDPRFANKQSLPIDEEGKTVPPATHNLNVLINAIPPEAARQVLEAMDAQEERVRKAELKPVDSVVVESPKAKKKPK